MRACPVDGTPLAYAFEPAGPDAVRVGRSDAAYCSPRCRQAASRARRGLRHGWGDASDRRHRRVTRRTGAAVTGHVATQGGGSDVLA